MGRRPILVGADVHRPAAMEQLRLLGEQIEVPAVVRPASRDAVEICRQAFDEAVSHQADAIIVDTAGRLQIDAALMQELEAIKAAVRPQHTFLIVDAMTGQEAVNVATAFDREVGIEGVILTKLDGDARGGAALSIQASVGKPIQYVGVGEKLDGLEAFHPERMASRLLGMGDVLTLIEKAEQAVDPESVAALESKIRQATFTLEDFQEQLRQVRQMGPLENLMGMIPGLKGAKLPAAGEKDLKKVEAIIGSMTLTERRHPGPYQWQETQAHRPRKRHPGGRRQPPAEAVQPDAQDDEVDGERQEQGPRQMGWHAHGTTVLICDSFGNLQLEVFEWLFEFV